MNTQLDRTKVGQTTTSHGDDHHDVASRHTVGRHDEGEQRGDKKSVLKKVKAKAKKIKDTITGRGHGHDHDEDDDDDDEMDTYPGIHGPPAAAHGVNVGEEGITKRHGTNIGEIGSHVPDTHPGSHRVFDPSTTHYVPGQEETLGWSRTDTGTPIPSALKHTPGIGHSSGTRSTGDLGFVQKPKYGGILEKDTPVLKHVGEDVLAADYQAKSRDATQGGHASPTVQDIGLGQGRGAARQHGDYVGGGTTIDEASHIPVSKPT